MDFSPSPFGQKGEKAIELQAVVLAFARLAQDFPSSGINPFCFSPPYLVFPLFVDMGRGPRTHEDDPRRPSPRLSPARVGLHFRKGFRPRRSSRKWNETRTRSLEDRPKHVSLEECTSSNFPSCKSLNFIFVFAY